MCTLAEEYQIYLFPSEVTMLLEKQCILRFCITQHNLNGYGHCKAGQLIVYDEIDKELKQKIRRCFFDRTENATENLSRVCARFSGKRKSIKKDLKWRSEKVEERLKKALVDGNIEFIDEDTGRS
ncbi:hypothetical protein CM15mP37_08120 [bacterium]|nr:MAG: hypothetical protein CM15mP37_08120 [bacterium]